MTRFPSTASTAVFKQSPASAGHGRLLSCKHSLTFPHLYLSLISFDLTHNYPIQSLTRHTHSHTDLQHLYDFTALNALDQFSRTIMTAFSRPLRNATQRNAAQLNATTWGSGNAQPRRHPLILRNPISPSFFYLLLNRLRPFYVRVRLETRIRSYFSHERNRHLRLR